MITWSINLRVGVASSTTIFCMDLIELTLGILKLSPIRDLGVCNTNYGVLKSKFSIFEWRLAKILLRHVDLTNQRNFGGNMSATYWTIILTTNHVSV